MDGWIYYGIDESLGGVRYRAPQAADNQDKVPKCINAISNDVTGWINAKKLVYHERLANIFPSRCSFNMYVFYAVNFPEPHSLLKTQDNFFHSAQISDLLKQSGI